MRKNRGWRKPEGRGSKPSGQSTDARKRVTTCSSCGFCQQCGAPVPPQDERMSKAKRERRNEEDDRWDLVDEPGPFTYAMPKERMRSGVGGGFPIEQQRRR